MITKAQFEANKAQARRTADKYLPRGRAAQSADRALAREADEDRDRLSLAVRAVERALPKGDAQAHVRASFEVLKDALRRHYRSLGV